MKSAKELREKIENSFKGKYVNGLDRKVLTDELTLIALKFARDEVSKVQGRSYRAEALNNLTKQIKELEG